MQGARYTERASGQCWRFSGEELSPTEPRTQDLPEILGIHLPPVKGPLFDRNLCLAFDHFLQLILKALMRAAYIPCGQKYGRRSPGAFDDCRLAVAIAHPLCRSAFALACSALVVVHCALRSKQKADWLQCHAPGSCARVHFRDDSNGRQICFTETRP